MSDRKVGVKSVAWFKFDNIRKQFDPDDLVRLGESLKRRQWHPVVAKSDGTVVDGERRVRAALAAGLETLDVIIIDAPMTKTELRLAQAATAMHRADLSGWEKYELCYELVQLNPDWQAKELAEHLAIDPSMVTRILSASKTVPEVREALKAGRLGTTDVYAISKEKSDAGQLELLAAKLNGASRDSIEQQAKRTRIGSARAVTLRRIKCPLVSGHVVMVTGADISLDDGIEALGEALKAMRKARDGGLNAATAQAVWKDVAAVGN